MKIIKKAYYDLKCWEKIINIQLLLLAIVGIILSIVLLIGSDKMLKDILINIGCSIITTVFLSMFIYFKYLKKIPDENRKQIDDLLNNRLNYETENHNDIAKLLNPSTSHLSCEHSEIVRIVRNIDKEIAADKRADKTKYELLSNNEKEIVNSVKVLNTFSEVMATINANNKELMNKNEKLQLKIMELEKQIKEQPQKQQYRGCEIER